MDNNNIERSDQVTDSNFDLFLKSRSSADRSAREAWTLQTLHGPGIVPLRVVGADGLGLEMAACSIADVLHERGPLPEGEVRAVGAAAAAALARVHDAGLVHGDVKPANLLLSRDGELWLADFDAAAAADGRPLDRFSPPRLPPRVPSRPAADITALALTLVELSTGVLLDPRVPWRATDLRRLGCSAALSAEIAFMLGSEGVPGSAGPALSAQSTAEMFEREGSGILPSPAVQARQVDPTPTVEFMPVRPSPPDSSPRSAHATHERPPRWWRRLAASWRPVEGPALAADRFQARSQASGNSQASRSSKVSRRTTRRTSPFAMNTTAGRRTLL